MYKDLVKEKLTRQAWRRENPDKVKAIAKACYARNKERFVAKVAEYQKANPEKANRWHASWRKKNRGWDTARVAKYNISKIQATPLWADESVIETIYAISSAWREAGFNTHVDHIIPLRGKLVSGLHVEGNLTILLAKDNSKKSNNYVVGQDFNEGCA